jgi:hypothetical protein
MKRRHMIRPVFLFRLGSVTTVSQSPSTRSPSVACPKYVYKFRKRASVDPPCRRQEVPDAWSLRFCVSLAGGAERHLEVESLCFLEMIDHLEKIASLRIVAGTHMRIRLFAGRLVRRLNSSNPMVALI